MKKKLPDYDKNNSTQKVFESFSKHNQEIIKDYINYCRKDAGEHTLNKYFNKLVQIADVIEKPIDKLTLKDILAFLSVLNTSKRKTENRNDLKKTLKRFLKWKYPNSKEFSDRILKAEIKQKQKGSSERLSKKDLLTLEEIEILVRSAGDLKWKAFIMLLWETGARPEEIYKLKWSDLDLNIGKVSVNSSKTGEARVIPLQECLIHLKRFYQEYPYPNVSENDLIFPGSERNRVLNYDIVGNVLKKLSKKIKKKVYPYLFRHSRLQMIRSKLSVEAYQKIAGHSIETALESYGHLDSEDAEKEMREKVLNIEELTPEEKDELKKLKKEMKALDAVVGSLAKMVLGQLESKSAWRQAADQIEEKYLSLKKELKTPKT